MRRILLIAVLLIVAAGCKKNNTGPGEPAIFGTWELRKEVGGIAGINKPYPPGNGDILVFNADSTFRSYLQFKLTDQGTFHIVKNGLSFGGQKPTGIFYNHSTYGSAIEQHADTLSIGGVFTDGITSIYVRQ